MKEKFTCRQCGIPIGAHNQYLHDGMCDECFFDVYFPEEAQIFETDIHRFSQICRMERKENMRFEEFLKSGRLDQKEFISIVKDVTEKIDCKTCGNCCRVLKMTLTKEDIDRISKYLDMSVEDFIKKYLTKNTLGIYEIKELPCVFLKKDNTCQIYEVRPEECKSYPHLDKDMAKRSMQFFINAKRCPIVFNVLENAKKEFLEEIYDFIVSKEGGFWD